MNSAVISSDGEERDSEPSQPAKRRKRTYTNASDPSAREIGIMRDGAGQRSAKFVGSASGIHFIRRVYDSFARRRTGSRQGHQGLEGNLVPGEDDQLHDSADSRGEWDSLWRQNEVTFTPPEILPFESVVEWTRHYFENWHPLLPFLHAPTILQVMEQVSSVGFGRIDPIDSIILRSIVSISLADSRQQVTSNYTSNPPSISLVFRNTTEALSTLQPFLCHPTSLSLLQAAVSVQLFLISMLKNNAAYRLGGLIVRMAFHLGLHRCPMRFPCFSIEESQLRQRLFWSIYVLERYLSQSLGLPLEVKDDDIDVCYPNDEKHVSPKTSTSFEDIEHQCRYDDRLRLLSYLARHAKIRGMILELRNKSIMHSKESYDRAVTINARLSRWWIELHESVEPALDGEAEDDAADGSSMDPNACILQPLHRILLLVLRHESIISLNRPLIAKDKSAAEYAAALQTCIESSVAIISALRRYMLQHTAENGAPAGNSGSTSGPLCWPSFTWAIWMSCLILLYAASEEQCSLSAAVRNVDRSLVVLKNLSLRGHCWPDACATAIRDLKEALLNSRQFPSNQNHSRSPIPGEYTQVRNQQLGGYSLQAASHDRVSGQSLATRQSPSMHRRTTPSGSEPRNTGNSHQLTEQESRTSIGRNYTSARSATDDYQLRTPFGGTASGDVPSASGRSRQLPSQMEQDPSIPLNQVSYSTRSQDYLANSWTAMNPSVDSTSALWQGLFDPQEYYRFSAINGFAAEDPFSIVDFPWLTNEDMLV